MKKYEVPVMKLHQLKPSTILAGSEPAKPFEDNSSINTQKYVEDNSYNPDNLYDE